MTSPEQILRENPEWFHSIELAPGVVTPGRTSLASSDSTFQQLRLPDLRGKSVLDIGACDGVYSFAAERAGAARVVALDHYVWSTDMVGYMKEYGAARASGGSVPAPHKSRYWKPDEMPGRRPFDAARSWLESKVEPVVGDFMTMDLEPLGTFDVVLFLGVLYHMEDPLGALSRVRSLTSPGGLSVVETAATEFPGSGKRALCEFFPRDELNNDASNWWVPNRAAFQGLCEAAGFERVEVLPRIRPVGVARNLAWLLKWGAAQTRVIPVPLWHRLAAHAWR